MNESTVRQPDPGYAKAGRARRTPARAGRVTARAFIDGVTRRLRKRGLFPLAAFLAACSPAAPAGPAARLGEHELSADRLAEILVLAQPLPLDSATATELAYHWIEVSLIAGRAAAGDSLLGPDLVAAAMAPELREARIRALLDREAGDALARALAITDSLYAAGDVRLLAHVFRRAGPDARPGEKEVQRIAAQQIRQRLAAGGSWADAVTQSEDPDTRDRDGLIGLVRRGDLVSSFENAAFALAPGAFSEVVETEFGFHIIRRPRLEEVRPMFTRLVADEIAASAESEIGAGLLSGAHLAVQPDAAARTRGMARDPWSALDRDDALVRHDGGVLRGADVARALLLTPAATRDALRQASDVEVEGFLRGLVLRGLLAARADSLGVPAETATAGEAARRYRDGIEAVWRAANISPDSVAAVADPDRLAAERVDRYIESVAARRVAPAAVPPLLTVALLEGEDWNVDMRAVGAAVESARRMLAAAEAR